MDNAAPTKTPTAAIAIITLKDAALAPIAEFKKFTASLLTPTDKSTMANTNKNMTKNKELSELTLNELYAEKKKIKGILMGFGIVMIIACIILIAVAVKSKNYALIAVASGSFITLLPITTRLGQIDKEIKTREQK